MFGARPCRGGPVMRGGGNTTLRQALHCGEFLPNPGGQLRLLRQ